MSVNGASNWVQVTACWNFFSHNDLEGDCESAPRLEDREIPHTTGKTTFGRSVRIEVG